MTDAPITGASTAQDQGITITRVFDAPRELVFAAWTDPAQFAAWFGGHSAVVPVETVSMDVRPGGSWSAVMLGDSEHPDIPWRGVYLDVHEPDRVVFTLTDRPGDAMETVTVNFTDLDGRTQMVFRQSGGNLTAEGYDAVKAGWTGFFDAMTDVLALG